MMKTCPICKQEKPHSEYHKYYSKARQKYRIANYCKPCARLDSNRRAKDHYRQNKDEKLEYSRQYRQENKDMLRRKARKFKRKQVEELQACYVADQASKVLGVPQRVISQNPEVVEAYRNIIRIKRKVKEHGKK